MKYTEAVYKRKRRGKVIYDGVLTYYDDEGARRFKHCERKTRGEALEALRDVRKKLESGGSKAVKSDRMTFSSKAHLYVEPKNLFISSLVHPREPHLLITLTRFENLLRKPI